MGLLSDFQLWNFANFIFLLDADYTDIHRFKSFKFSFKHAFKRTFNFGHGLHE